MGCNCKDFKKTDLLKDKEVLGHIKKVREEKEKADIEKKEVEMKAREDKRKRKVDGNESDRSADSIVEEVIEMIKEKGSQEPALKKGCPEPVPARKEPNLSESSSSSDQSTSDDSTSKSTSDTSSEAPISKSSTEKVASTREADDANIEPEKSKSNQNPGKEKRPSKRRRVVPDVADTDSEDSDSDVPLSRARARRSRKQPRKLDNSFSGCEFDDNNTGSSSVGKRGRKNLKQSKKIKIVGKKVTETWCIEKQAKLPKKRRAKEKWTNVVPNEDFESDEDVPVSRKGKSSKNKPSKNPTSEDGTRPKRAQKVSYVESDDEF